VIPGIDETSFNFISSLPCSINVTIDPIFVENSQPQPDNTTLISYNETLPPYGRIVFQEIEAVDYNISASGCPVGPNTIIQFPPTEYLSQPRQVWAMKIKRFLNNTSSFFSNFTNT
jgi:hypothetical protein